MPSLGRMCYLTTVVGSFHGRVLAARLGAEGVLVVLKGTTEGPYPLPSAVDVLVPIDQLMLAREILLADAVDDAFGEMALGALSSDGDDGGRLAEVGWAGDSAPQPLPIGDASDTFSFTSDARGDRRPHARVRGLPAAAVVLLVATMIAVACLAAAAR
jgi:hypothetical protein